MKNKYRILVFSDSHGAHKEMIKAVNKQDYVDMILHAGDHARDLNAIASRINFRPILKAVKGNCDFGLSVPKDAFFDVRGVTILMTHGNELGVKQGLHKIDYLARQRGADIVIFGHTHLPALVNKGDLYILNPGTIGDARSMGKTYAIIEIGEDKDIRIDMIRHT
jgi:uncharacterized protein